MILDNFGLLVQPKVEKVFISPLILDDLIGCITVIDEGRGARWLDLLDQADGCGISKDQVAEGVDRMITEGILAEPELGYIKIIRLPTDKDKVEAGN